MATVQQLYDTTQYLINKYDGSFMSQDEFLQAYNLASTDYFNYLIDMSYAVMSRNNIYSTPTNADNQTTEALSPFLVFEQSLASPYNKPADYARAIYLKTAYPGQAFANGKFATRIEPTVLDSKLYSEIDAPNAEDPVYIEASSNFLFYPSTPSVGVWLTSYNKPADYARAIYLKTAYPGQAPANGKFATRIEPTVLDSKLYSDIDSPNAEDPVYLESGSNFLFYPSSPSVGVWLTYYKKPVRRIAVDGTSVEWADNKINNVLFRVLGYLGINLKDPSLIQFGNIKKVDA